MPPRFIRSLFHYIETPTPAIYTLSLHDALPIWATRARSRRPPAAPPRGSLPARSCSTSSARTSRRPRSEEHTSELQSRGHLVCRLLLEKKKEKGRHIEQNDEKTITAMTSSQ